MFKIRYSFLFPEQFQYIIPVRKNEETEKNNHSYYLGVFDEFITWFTPEYDLIKQEHYVTAIQCRDRQHIQDSKHNGQEGGQVPECRPVPG